MIIERRRAITDIFSLPTEEAARHFLGCLISTDIGREVTSGRVVEVEAYTSKDEASHSFRGKTIRNSPMFGVGGTIYVYRSYGIHACVNIVTEDEGSGSAVLIRAIEPLQGVDIMKRRRNISNDIQITNGPGKLTQALGIDLALNGTHLNASEHITFHFYDPLSFDQISVSKRIGITKAVDTPWRFFIKDNPWVSKVKAS